MNCAITVDLSSLNADLERDVCRIDELWQEGLARFGGGFLAGERFTAVDAFTARWHSGCSPTSWQSHLSRSPTVKNCFRCLQ